ncbi:hypothetical protein Vafri_13495 [Volvox africanus]|nr:hypothetical protein Vafri_13495 [Volvox africanus]
MESDKQETTKSRWVACWDTTRAFIVKNYLPIAFLVALGLALAWPVPGRFLANVSILGNVRICQVAAMVLVFLITGLQLNTSEVKRALALRNLPVLVYGFTAILIITPCLGFALRVAPLNPWEFATGLAIFTVAPTTLGVGVALTEACGGNRAMALLLTVGTNALAVFTMPPELRLLLPHGKAAAAEGVTADNPAALNMNVQITDLLVKLAITVLAPFIIGKVVREVWPAAEKFAKNNRVPLSLTSTTALAFVVWQTLSAARDLLLDQRPGPVFAMIGLAIAMHLAYLLGNYLVVWFILRAPLREAIAVVIMSSQKSAPVAVTTITFMTKDAAQQGLLSLPSIVGQLCQIFIGAALAKWLFTVVERSEQKEKAAAAAEAAAAGPGAVDDAQGGSVIGKAAPAAASGAGELQLIVPVSSAAAAAICDIPAEGRDTSKIVGAVSESSPAVPGCLVDGDGDQTYRAQGRPQGGVSGEGPASALGGRGSALLESRLPSSILGDGNGGSSLPPVAALPTPKTRIQTSPYQHIPGQTSRPSL